MTDPQLIHRGHFRTTEHPMMGQIVLEGPRVVYSRTPAEMTSPGPTLGQHTVEILTEILGYDEDRLVTLLTSGALE